MKKLLALIAFSLLLLVPVGAQNAFGSLIGDEVTVDNSIPNHNPITETVNSVPNPEFVFPDLGPVGLSVSIESEEIWIEYDRFLTFGSTFISDHDWWITDLDWIVNGVEVPGNIQGVVCTADSGIPLGPVTFTNSEIHITVNSVSLISNENKNIHCDIDVIHGGQAVGGELIPLDSTMILAAGAQYTAAWMIPVIVSAIGIGIVIARKF